MTELLSIQKWIAIVAIICAILNFGVYIAFSLKALAAKEDEKSLHATVRSVAKAAPPTMDQLAAVLKALASLAESLVKAGPALWAMIGSALFLLIASLAAGVFGGSL